MSDAPQKPRKESFNLRLHPGSIERIDVIAKLERRNRSDMIRAMLAERLEEYEAKHGIRPKERRR